MDEKNALEAELETNLLKLNSLKKVKVEEAITFFDTILSIGNTLSKKTADFLLERYPHSSGKVQTILTRLFLAHKIEDAIPLFLNSLKDAGLDNAGRNVYLRIISEINKPEGYRGLAGLLITGPKPLRRSILDYLGKLDDGRWRMFCWSLEKMDAVERRKVLELLGKVHYARTARFVISGFNSEPNRKQKEFLMDCFHDLRIVDRYIDLIKNLDSGKLKTSAKALTKIESDLVGYFMDALSSRDDATRLKIVEMFEYLEDKNVKQPLKYLLQTDVNNRVVSKAIKVFSEFAEPESVISMGRNLLNRVDPRVRANTIEAFGSIGYVAEDILRGYLKDPNNRVRANAAKALAPVDPDAARETLLEMLNDERPLMKASALWAIGELGWVEYADLINPLLEHSDEIVRSNAEKALGKFSTADSGIGGNTESV